MYCRALSVVFLFATTTMAFAPPKPTAVQWRQKGERFSIAPVQTSMSLGTSEVGVILAASILATVLMEPGSASAAAATQEELAAAFRQPEVTVLDVRGMGEIESSGKIDEAFVKAVSKNKDQRVTWVQTPGTPMDTPALSSNPEALMPDKEETIIVHCASGKRSGKAKDILDEKGYKNVVDGGAYKDIKATFGE